MDRSEAIRARRVAAGREDPARPVRRTRTPRHERPSRPAERQRRKRRAGRVLLGLAVVFVVLAAAIASVGWFYLYKPDTETAAGKPVTVTIVSGSSTEQIAQQLAEVGVVENAAMFRLRSRLAESDGTLKAGEYELSTGMPYELVIAKLAAGPDIAYFDVPIPEGFTVRQIAERFAARAEIPEDEILAMVTSGAKDFATDHSYLADTYGNSLEGYLFPATYRVKEGTSAQQVVEMMLDKFDEVIAGVDLSYAKSKNLDVNDVVIIASILERESKLPKEFPLVSSVIYNRLKKPMRLQLCATVLYKMPEGTTRLTDADTKRESPYNTYIHDGLPVGPISSPGLAALDAAANPAKTDYFYYVLTGKDGSQTFTHSYEDFLQAKQVYLEVYGQ